jgi:hypothetical protein
MPRYFFDLRNDIDARDEEGRDLPDLRFMRKAALAEAREMMTESVLDGKPDLNHRIEVRNEVGDLIYTLRFADAVHIIPARGEVAPAALDPSAEDQVGG